MLSLYMLCILVNSYRASCYHCICCVYLYIHTEPHVITVYVVYTCIFIQSLMLSDSSPVIDYYPVDFETDLNGKQQEWEAVVLIPFIDEVCHLLHEYIVT